MSIKQNEFYKGMRTGIPICIGYIPAAIAFGLVSRNAGLLIGDTVLFSMTNFAGASQFLAVNLIRSGALLPEIVLGVLLVNMRYLLLSASLSQRFDCDNPAVRALVAFGNTDEVFTVASSQQSQLTPRFVTGLEVTAWAGWVSGSIIGFLIGMILPLPLQQSIGITLYALFVSLLVGEVKSQWRYAGIALIAGAVNTCCILLLKIPSGWSMILAICTASVIGMHVLPQQDQDHLRPHSREEDSYVQ